MNNKLKYAALLSAVILPLSLVGCQSQSINNSTPQTATLQQTPEVRMMAHLKALQSIAQKHEGHRAVATAGGLATAQYIRDYAKQKGLTAQLIPFENSKKKVGHNVIVEIKGQSIDKAIIIGAHYDSVDQGPGINDNGSGVAVVLELMDYYAQTTPKQTMYFAFWDSEEEGIAGSKAFVDKMSAKQLQGVSAYINVDMVGTKTPTIMLVDSTKSSVDEMEQLLKQQNMKPEDYQPLIESLRAVPTHAGDTKLENYLTQFFKARSYPVRKDVSTLLASDTLPFLGKVPVASLVFFNEQMKGNVLEFAPCYHQACDTLEGIEPKSLNLAIDAIQGLVQHIQTTP